MTRPTATLASQTGSDAHLLTSAQGHLQGGRGQLSLGGPSASSAAQHPTGCLERDADA